MYGRTTPRWHGLLCTQHYKDGQVGACHAVMPLLNRDARAKFKYDAVDPVAVLSVLCGLCSVAL